MIQILLNCARQEMSPALLASTKVLCAEQVDWELLVRTAWRHGVAPLLQQHLSGFDLPNECKNALRQCYVRAAVRSRTHFAAITQLMREFAEQSVPVMLLKGAALGLTTYRDAALRPFADIDLLIHEENLEAAKTVMQRCGYALARELISESLARRFHVNLPFVKTDPSPVHVELHWQLSDRFRDEDLPLAEFWERAPRLAFGDTFARFLRVEDAISYLSAHLDKHGYFNQALRGDAAGWIIDELSANRLIWFTDLHESITRNAIDWSMVERNDASISSLSLLQHLLGTPGIPKDFLQRHPPPYSKRLAFRLAQWAAKKEWRRNFYRRHILTTRKGFELRLVRLLDLWGMVWPGEKGSIEESARVIRQSFALFFALLAVRLRRR